MSDRIYTYLAGEDILLFKRRYTAFQEKTHRLWMNSWMAGFMLLLFTLTACVGEELQKPLLGEGEGYLTLQIGAISAEVTSSTLTKATVPNAPTEEQLSIKITNKSTGDSTTYANISAVPNPLVLTAGVTYTVEASYGTNNALQEIPYFYDSQEVTIQANTNNPVTVTATLKNAMIIPDISSIKNHYEDGWKLTASAGNDTIPLEFINGTCTFYAKAGETVSLNFKGTNKAGQSADTTWISIKNVEASKAYKVQCNPNLDAFKNIQVTATAEHTKDSNGDLNETVVTFSADLHGANEKAIDSWTVKVCNRDEQIIRTYTGSSLDNMTYEDTGWPYIPQLSTLSASVKLKAGDVIDVKGDFTELPKPKFTVTASAYTSYNKYKDEQNIAEANACDGSKIYAMQAVPTISDESLTNSNYSGIKSSTLKLDNGDVTITNPDSMAVSWGAHELTATYTFDGVKAESPSTTYHVTGLPYTADFDANRQQNLGWTLKDGAYWRKIESLTVFEVYKLMLNGGFIVSPKFHIPSDINISVPMEVQCYRATWYSSTYTVGSTNSTSQKATANTNQASAGGDANTIVSKTSISMTSKLTTNEMYLSVSASENNSFVYSVRINYR